MSSRKPVKSVYLCYENLEGADIPLKFIGDFRMDNITQCIRRLHTGAPDLFIRAEEFFIEIDRSFDSEILKQAHDYNAITSVIVEFTDGDEQKYLVPWTDPHNRYENQYQTSRFNKHGDLFIAITKEQEHAENFMPDEIINDDKFKLHTVDILEPISYTAENAESEREKYKISGILTDDMPIDVLDLSVRSHNCLFRAGINTIKDLSMQSEASLTKVRNLGRRSREEVINKCKACGIEIPEESDEGCLNSESEMKQI